MKINDLKKDILPSCCHLSSTTVDSYSSEGISLIHNFFPDAKTVLITYHHITSSLEWAWFPFETERGGNTCAADLHAKIIIEAFEQRLTSFGYKSMILPYPDDCGISFKRLANISTMGEMGDSFLFLHHEWGPWVHLRVLLTNANISDNSIDRKNICKHCYQCLESCPGSALADGDHNLHVCGLTQQRSRDALMIKSGYRYKCERCARACPVGQAPMEIVIQDKISQSISK